MDNTRSQPSFANMNSTTIKLWVQEAQFQLPEANSSLSELLTQGIEAALAELAFRDKFITESEKACDIARLND
jgi:hypothetical protein